MKVNMRIMSPKPLNAETPVANLQSWITSNAAFFKRNQEVIMTDPVALETWRLSITGLVEKNLELSFDDILAIPKIEVANTMECSGNGRSLLRQKASGNPWTIGGVGNAVWGGICLRDVLARAGVLPEARHVSFEGMDNPDSKSPTKFIRSIPLEKAMDSTILAYEMNGEPLPLEHGYPLRAVALGWTGANCVKWLGTITLLDRPATGFFMDKVYRVFQKGEEPQSGEVVTTLSLKSIITAPEQGDTLPAGTVVIRGAAFAGEGDVTRVEVSVDNGASWHDAVFVGPHERYAWRRWEYQWKAAKPGEYTIMARATDDSGTVQPLTANWNVLGYGNNGSREHGVTITIG
jgi:DMSO/TMAO reductase YedYZ molybdopterin-dependent catalytic subunit